MSFVEAAGADADERDAIAMARIHVRLNLEHEAGEPFVGRADDPRIARPRLRRRRELDERLEERLEAEVRQRAAEEDRRLPSGAILRRRRSGVPAVADDVERLAEMRVDVCRRSPPALRDRRARRCRPARDTAPALRARRDAASAAGCRRRRGTRRRCRSASSPARRRCRACARVVDQLQRIARRDGRTC